VSITIFANPGKAKDKQWKEFIEQYGIRLQTVSRNVYGIEDPNDTEIVREARRIAATEVRRIALLVYDADFIPLVKELQHLGKEPIVILRNSSMRVLAQRFERMKVPVLFTQQKPLKGNVFAVLEADGTGKICVKGEDLEYPYVDADTIDFVANHMESLRYRKPGETAIGHVLVPAVAKFWYANELGSLTVFPNQILFQEMHEAWLRHAGKLWLSCESEFAFVLPRSANRTGAWVKRYGGKVTASFVHCGGPFLLKDSDTVVEEVLHRLGFMDTCLNSDLNEAIQVFSTMSINKRNLKKVGMKPSDLDGYSSCLSILRHALLSNESSGVWQVPPGDTRVREYLIARGFLPGKDATKADIFQVFKKHSRRLGLPNHKTYNGYVLSLTSRLTHADPNRRRLWVL